jgi:hypothetical protein
MAPLIAPQSEWPRTTMALAPASFCREFEASDDIGVDEVPGDAGDEDVADSLVEDQLGRHPAVDAPDERRERRLPGRGRSNLGKEIAVNTAPADEAGVAVL